MDGRRRPGILAGSQVTAIIDVMIFEDGEVVGANITKYDAELEDRQIAAKQLASQLRNAMARGEDPNVTLANLIQSAPASADLVGVWTQRYAQTLKNSNSAQGMIPWLETPLKLPKFYKSN